MIIGLCGFKRSGKTTVANYLKEEHGFKSLNFKDSLIEELKQNFPDLLDTIGLIQDRTIDELLVEKPPLMRALMQNYGTEVRRGDDPDYWVKRWKEKCLEAEGNIVVDDVRFENEANALAEQGGILIRVVRNRQDVSDTHPSETEHLLFKEDFTIAADDGEHLKIYGLIEGTLDTVKSNVD